MITAENLTDEQIREYRDSLIRSHRTRTPIPYGTRHAINTCDTALGLIGKDAGLRRVARAEISKALNAARAPFAVAYQTAVVSRHPTEREAWTAHDALVIAGLDPDSLAVVRVAENRAPCGPELFCIEGSHEAQCSRAPIHGCSYGIPQAQCTACQAEKGGGE